MKALVLLALASSAVSSAFASNIVLHDDFDGGVVDTSKWTVIIPQGSSSVIQSGGELTTRSRGILATAHDIPTPYTISGIFSSNDLDEIFTVTLRSNLSATPFYHGRKGVSVSFGDTNNTIDLYAIDADGTHTNLAAAVPYSFTTGGSYAFEITDDGFDIAVSINGTPIISGSSSLALGGRVAFYSREWTFTNSSIESVTITSSAIPEPASFAVLAGLGVLGLAATRRRRAA